MRWTIGGWLATGAASVIAAGFAVVPQVAAGAINQGLVVLAASAVLVPLLSFGADRVGWPWGRVIAVIFAIVLAGLGALWEWFMWIGDVQGYGYQKVDAALLGAVVAGLAAAGVYALGSATPRMGSLLGSVAAVVVLPAFIGQAMVTAGRYEPPNGTAPTPAAPAAVRERAKLPSCGDDLLGPEDQPINREAHECLLRAHRAGRAAELRIDRKTVIDRNAGGKPLTQIIRALDDGTIEVFRALDSDAHALAWDRMTCIGLARGARPHVFALEGCTTPVPVSE